MNVDVPRPSIRVRITTWAIDGALLGLFMVAVGLFVPLIDHPRSPVAEAISSPLIRRMLIGLAMGLTAVALIYSPWGGRSGAHMNPAMTLTFLRLGKIHPVDALGYVLAQFIGGYLGVVITGLVVGAWFTDDPIHFAPTVPGPQGPWVAFAAEFLLTAVLMMMVLITSNRAKLSRFTGIFAGLLLMIYIGFESPLSGMSINPARTIASTIPSGNTDSLWVYLTAPLLGMLVAAEVYTRVKALPGPHCCKLNHDHPGKCIHCGCDGPIHFDQHQESPT